MAKKKAGTTRKQTKKAGQPKTTSQQLGSLLKSARDIMRKDKGLNGDLDRLPMLTWIMFLKFLDDREKLEETRAAPASTKYKSAIAKPYRWRDWAAKNDGITGEELIAFANNDEAMRSDGKRGPGLLAYLKSLQGTNGNSLATKISEIGDRQRVDVILTNPPFGGEEEAGIRTNFPADKQTSETALLFLQLIMRKLRRPGRGDGGRAAVVVPNGTLFGDGVCARIKEDLLKNFNLHTIVRLPNGVFAPYTSISVRFWPKRVAGRIRRSTRPWSRPTGKSADDCGRGATGAAAGRAAFRLCTDRRQRASQVSIPPGSREHYLPRPSQFAG